MHAPGTMPAVTTVSTLGELPPGHTRTSAAIEVATSVTGQPLSHT